MLHDVSPSAIASDMRVCRGPTSGRSLRPPLLPRYRGQRSVMSPTGHRRARDSADPPVTSTSSRLRPPRPLRRHRMHDALGSEPLECTSTTPITPSVSLDGKAESAGQWTSTHARLRTTPVCRFSSLYMLFAIILVSPHM